ncbi:hypothetical protein Rhopal_003904-T1 [Rhodotorula paludigena]|uniref:Uncharacterized protein n=1 Tax=Rhodotorula paludigena TaxID=86838 RepID=A0AAV5GED8_9BASI|nr:hypothetical protein Rhopal_003904-T1 [Rhodotorula paludigena]
MQVPDASHSLSFPKLKDVHVWVQVDGEPLEVYATDETRSKSMGFIESVENKCLELCLSDQRKEQPEDSWIVQFFSEHSELATVGQDCSEPSVLYGAESNDQRRFRKIEGEYDAKFESVKRFRFFKLPVSPDAEPHALPANEDDEEDDVVIEPKKSVTPKQPSPSPSPSPKDRSPTPPAADATSTSGEGDVERLKRELKVAELELALFRAQAKVEKAEGKHGRDESAGEPMGAAKKRK